jgi:hypothetical protein
VLTQSALVDKHDNPLLCNGLRTQCRPYVPLPRATFAALRSRARRSGR